MAIEFYTFEQEVWCRIDDGSSERLTERSTEIINFMIEQISQFYPAAYSALCSEYERCKPNLTYYRFRIVQRFCKCNFGNIDNIPDVPKFGKFNLECVPCPLKGECRHEHVICQPQFDHRISAAELRVMKLLYSQIPREDIAESLCLSIHTVNNHIHNALARLNLHNTAEFMKYAGENKIFQ